MADKNKIEFQVKVDGSESINKMGDDLKKVEGGLKGVGQEADKTGSLLGAAHAKIVAWAAAVMAAVASFVGIKLFGNAIQSAGEFEGALSRVKAATDASAEEMAALKQAAEDAGSNTKYTSTEAAGALENLAKAGLTAKEAITALPPALSLAQAGDVALGESAEYLTKIVMGMGLSFTDAGRVADVLAKGANASNTSVKGLAEALSYTAPIAHSLGLSFESTVAIVGKFADAGIDASRAGTALNSILSQFIDPASKFRESLNGIGITTNNFEQALGQLAAAGPRGANAINAVGQEAGPALRALLNQGMGALDELKAKLEDSAGSAAHTAAIMEDNLPGAMRSLGSAWDTVMKVLGTPVLPVLKDAVNSLAASLRSLVSDGSVGKFGEAMAEAFRAGIKWGQDFIAQIDFKAIVASMQEFATEANQVFVKVGDYASNAGNSVKLAYGVMSAGVNVVLAAIYGIGSVFSETASIIMEGVAWIREKLASISFGGLSASFKLAAEDARNAAQGFGDAAQAMRDKASAALIDTADAAQMARDGFVGLATSGTRVSEASAKADADIKAMAASIEAAGKAAETSGQKQSKAATDAAAATAAQAERVKALRAEYEQQMALGNLQAAAEIMQKIDAAQQAVGASAKVSSEQISALAAAMAAKNTVAQAAVNLELAQERAYEATMQAMGNEYAVLQSKIRQKEIEIKLVEANVKAMNDEANASIRVAEAKLAEMADNKEVNPALEAELRNRIELAKAKKLEAQAAATGVEKLQAEIKMLRDGTDARDKGTAATLRSAQARDAATAALERENAEIERSIAAQEKANQLKERELQLFREKWNIDKDGFTKDSLGNRQVMTVHTQTSVYNQAKDAGLSEEDALKVADSYNYDYGNGPTASTVNKDVNEAIVAAARKKVAEEKAQASTSRTTDSSNSGDSSSATSTQSASSGLSSGNTYISNITLNGKTTSVKFADAASQSSTEQLLRDLSEGKGVY